MEINNTSNKKGLKLKFAGFYILSLAIVAFIISVLVPRMASSGTLGIAKPLDNNNGRGNDLLTKVEVLNTQYKKIKQLDQEYSRKIIDSAGSAELNTLNSNIADAENNLTKKIDSLEIIAKDYSDQSSSASLHDFTESFRLIMYDRSSMQAFKNTMLSKGDANADQQNMLRMQGEIQARNSRIVALESQISALGSKSNTVAAVPSNTGNNQQNTDALNATINAQEKKIASLTAINASLEKDMRVNNDALEQAKKMNDNSSASIKNQTAALEKKVSDLNAEIRFAQVDCNLARVDATQIVSNGRQRKLLLADALSTLNILSTTGDASVKKKAMDKMNRLNQIASSVRD